MHKIASQEKSLFFETDSYDLQRAFLIRSTTVVSQLTLGSMNN